MDKHTLNVILLNYILFYMHKHPCTNNPCLKMANNIDNIGYWENNHIVPR